MIKEEWKALKKSRWFKVVLAAIVVIPTIYASIFLGSMWDPYGNADKIPVAVVNKDQEVQYNDHTLAIGNELVNNLKENKAMDFQFVDEKKADQGLEKGTYYMKITIPKDFSSCATTLLDSQPKKMVLEYTTNPGSNYIASKMDESAITKIKESISASVTKTYATTIFDQIATLSDGLKQASDGSGQLDTGVSQVVDGNQTISTNLQTLASSSLRFKDGTETLEIGLNSYVQGVSQVDQGAQSLQAGTTQLQQQTTPLVSGMQGLTKGASAVMEGVKGYGNGIQQLTMGSQALVQNNSALNTGMDTLLTGIQKISSGVSLVNQQVQGASTALTTKLQQSEAGITKLQQSNEGIKANVATVSTAVSSQSSQIDDAILTITTSSLSNEDKATVLLALNNAKATNTTLVGNTTNPGLLANMDSLATANNQTITSLVDGLKEVKVGMDGTTKSMGAISAIDSVDKGLKEVESSMRTTLVPSVQQYSDGVTSLNNGLTQVNQKTNTLVEGSKTVAGGLQTVNDKLPSLTKGIEQLQTGSVTLSSGTKTLVNNNPTLLTGTKTLADGSEALSDGAGQLADGSLQLASGLTELKEGTGTLTTSLQQGAISSNLTIGDATIDMMATPVDTNHQEISKVENNGYAMAPYMMSVALYVACMAFTLMYPLLKNIKEARSGFQYWVSKASVMYSVSTIQALVMIAMLMLVNGMVPSQVAMTCLLAVCVSAAFMAMIVFFNILLGKIGSFLVLIFMVLQLGGAAGTYPIETSGGFYQVLHAFMPFSYSVEGFRHTLSMTSFVEMDILVFIVITIVFSVLSIFVYQYKSKHPISRIEEAFD